MTLPEGTAPSLNLLGDKLEPCSMDPVTGYLRNGCCEAHISDGGAHTVCAVLTAEFLEFSKAQGNDLSTPRPEFGFGGLKPGDRWCVTAANWLRAHMEGAAAPVVLASTHERATEIVPLDILKLYAVDVPADLTELETLDEQVDRDDKQPDVDDPESPDA